MEEIRQRQNQGLTVVILSRSPNAGNANNPRNVNNDGNVNNNNAINANGAVPDCKYSQFAVSSKEPNPVRLCRELSSHPKQEKTER